MGVAYNVAYLPDAKDILGTSFSYATSNLGFTIDDYTSLFVNTGFAKLFGEGNPWVIAGMTGLELAGRVADTAYGTANSKNSHLKSGLFYDENAEKSPEYWAGWVLAEYQWARNVPFKAIFGKMPGSEICRMYKVFHEMDTSKFINVMDERLELATPGKNLKKQRSEAGLSQNQLAHITGVNVRSIQMYEQGVNDINKAQAGTLQKLAKAMNCSIEDLLDTKLESYEIIYDIEFSNAK